MIFQRSTLVLLLSLLVFRASPQAQSVLDQYIAEAFQNNLVIRDKKIGLERSLLAIKEARSLLMPTTWFETQYTLAQGGRNINIPIGDLLNPVYNTLNQLTSSNNFTNVSNVKEQFLPNNFYDVRIKTTLPVLNPDLHINRAIKAQENTLQEIEVNRYKRELVLEIKRAYYNYLMSLQAVSILESAETVVLQNLKVNQSLLRNGKGLPAYVSRAESEVIAVQTQLASARNQVQNAIAYFNFLLNRSFNTPVHADTLPPPVHPPSLLPPAAASVDRREELLSLGTATGIANNLLKMNRAFAKPRLNAFFDLAAQDFNFRVNRNSFFFLGGFQLVVPIYSAKRNLYKVDASRLQLQQLALQTEQTQQQLQLAVVTAGNNVRNAYNSYRSAARQEQAAAQYFQLIDRGYREGVNSFIEFLDARNQHTNARLQTNIEHFRFLAGMAEYERQTAAINLP